MKRRGLVFSWEHERGKEGFVLESGRFLRLNLNTEAVRVKTPIGE